MFWPGMNDSIASQPFGTNDHFMSGGDRIFLDGDAQKIIATSRCQQICADVEARSLELIFSDVNFESHPEELIPYLSTIMPSIRSLRIDTLRFDDIESRFGMDDSDLVPICSVVSCAITIIVDPNSFCRPLWLTSCLRFITFVDSGVGSRTRRG